MRRRLRKFLPIVMLALAVQILAPIAASWAAGLAASDPLASLGAAAICHTSGSQTDTGPSGPTGHQDHESCTFCCLAHASASLDAPQVAVAEPYLRSERIAWTEISPQSWDARSGGHAQARAPPSNF